MATKSPTSASTIQAAGVKTPASGAYSDPAQVGAMIQKMYPGYYDNFDPSVIGQRWIDMHTATAGTGTGSGTDTGLSGPTGTTPLTSTDPNQNTQNTPDLSGLSQFQSPNESVINYSINTHMPVNSQPQAPLIGNGVISNNESSSATMAPPKQKQKQKSNPIASQVSVPINYTPAYSPAPTRQLPNGIKVNI